MVHKLTQGGLRGMRSPQAARKVVPLHDWIAMRLMINEQVPQMTVVKKTPSCHHVDIIQVADQQNQKCFSSKMLQHSPCSPINFMEDFN
mmetsp:Transcript_13510/g.28225  ORF Transcript_13510/g.28225 Transcript_13510/m.28225 type:complete len:89 (+) Transcript_13510:202-468(+)